MIVVLMGAAGAGKTTVGRALAARLGWSFVDADDLHSAESIDKIRRGQPLDDVDRGPWLTRVHDVMKGAADRGGHLVVACSALREQYRRQLAHDIPDLKWIFLRAGRSVLHRRLSTRQGHFAGADLLDSQLAVLEPPFEAITLDAEQPVEALVDEVSRALALPRLGSG